MNNTKKGINRKLAHISIGLILVFLIDINIITLPILISIVILGIIISLLSKKINIPVVYWFLQQFDKEEDIKKSPGKGALNFFAGSLLALTLFDKNLALAAIMILTLGDSLGYLVGKHYGKTKHPLNNKKLLEGTIIGIIVSFVGAAIFLTYIEALIAATIAITIEAIEIKLNKEFILDDNLTIPLVSGLVVTILRFF